MARSPLFTVATPFPQASQVTLWDVTWHNHIVTGHPELAGQMSNVQSTLAAPTAVCAGTNPATNLAFVNHGLVDAKGAPLVVFVSPTDSSGQPAVATAYFNKKYVDLTQTTLLWTP